jgi:arylsulfatase A-like enzyme
MFNIVLLISDDDPKKYTHHRDVMPKKFHHMVDGGIDYDNGFCSTPLCTPTRWTMICGKHQHTHRVTVNTDTGYSAGKSKGLLLDTPATRLQSMGYRVGYFGKIQNGYFNMPLDLPPGYDQSAWFVHANKIVDTEPSHTFNEFGTVRTFAQPPHYSSELITSRVESFLNQQSTRPEPFFITASYLSPHSPYKPEPEYEHLHDDTPLAITPNMTGMSPAEREAQQQVQEGKLEEVQELDEAIDRIYTSLAANGQLENTYVIHVADNGYLLGEHDQYQKDKWWNETVKIPFTATGPTIPAGVKSPALVSHIDIPTTIADLAGASWSDWDGRSLVPTFSGVVPTDWRTKVLIESTGSGWKMLRTMDYQTNEAYAYIQRSNKTEPILIFDIGGDDADPYELTNIVNTAEGQQVKSWLQPILNSMVTCRGNTCRVTEA